MRTASDSSDDGNNNKGGRGGLNEHDGKSGGFFLSGNSGSGSPSQSASLDFFS